MFNDKKVKIPNCNTGKKEGKKSYWISSSDISEFDKYILNI